MPIYSVLIQWADRDLELGTYGWTGEAKNEADAGDKARRAMWADSEEVAVRELYALDTEYPADKPPFGPVIECQRGAMWDAANLEAALRELVDATTVEAREVATSKARTLLDKLGKGEG